MTKEIKKIKKWKKDDCVAELTQPEGELGEYGQLSGGKLKEIMEKLNEIIEYINKNK